MKPKIFVTQPIPPKAMRILEEVADVEVFPPTDRMISVAEMIQGVAKADYLFALHGNLIPSEVIHVQSLRGIGIMGGRSARLDFDAALERRLPVVSQSPSDVVVGGSVAQSTADLTVGLVVALAYRIVEADQVTRGGRFQQYSTRFMGVGCTGKTVGLIGLGRVGRHMVPRLRAFDLRVVYCDRRRLDPAEEERLKVEWVSSMDEVLSRADFVCVTVDYNETTHKLLSRREFSLMRPSAYLVNTSRGCIVDEIALIEALQGGTIAGAGLDVYWNEPPVVYQPEVPAALCELSNVILTPHYGGATAEVRSQTCGFIAVALAALIRGERPAGLVNPEVYGEPILYPENYGRGPIIPISMGGAIKY